MFSLPLIVNGTGPLVDEKHEVQPDKTEIDFRLIPIPRSDRPNHHDLPLDSDLIAICDATRDLYERMGYEPPWISYLAEADGNIVGGGAFVGPPVDGTVEIAYFTLPDFESRGNAGRTAAVLVRIAQETDPQLVLTAKTMPEHGRSTRVLESLGFLHAGTVSDHEIGVAWYWEKRPGQSS